MAGAEKLLEKIADDAQRDAEKYWHNAEEKKKAMLDTLLKEIEQRKKEIEKMAVEAGKEKKRRMSAVYDLEFRKKLLAAKQEMMEKAKSLALEKLLSLNDADYTALMKKKLLLCAKTGEESIAVSSKETRLGDAFLADVNSELKKTLGTGNIKILPEKKDISGGFIFIDGGMEINMTLEAQLNEAWHDAETEIANVLFEQS